MTEAQLQTAIKDWCKDHGLAVWDWPDSRRTQSGWVDLVILGRRALFAELKSADGRRSRAQMRCAAQLARAGLDYRLWRPEDWDAGTITKELEAIR